MYRGPGIQSKLMRKQFCKGYDRMTNNSEQRVRISIEYYLALCRSNRLPLRRRRRSQSNCRGRTWCFITAFRGIPLFFASSSLLGHRKTCKMHAPPHSAFFLGTAESDGALPRRVRKRRVKTAGTFLGTEHSTAPLEGPCGGCEIATENLCRLCDSLRMAGKIISNKLS